MEKNRYYRRDFQEKRLLFLPDHANPRWTGLDDWVWDGPGFLTKIARVKDYYPHRGVLFRCTICLPVANFDNLIAEAQRIMPGDELPYIKEVLTTTSKLGQILWYTPACDLKNYPVMPIWGEHDVPSGSGSVARLQAAGRLSQLNEWYIADAVSLYEDFRGRVPLLAFPPPVLDEMAWFIDWMDCKDRKLSSLVRKRPATEGLTTLDPSYTAHIRDRWRCIARYASLSLSLSLSTLLTPCYSQQSILVLSPPRIPRNATL